MDAQQFLAEFGYIANAPGGVARLRELVLQFAISGRLVRLDVRDTALAESLATATEQRQKYEEDFDINPTLRHRPIEVSPYEIPNHWKWVRLEDVTLYVQRGKGPKYANRGSVWVVSQKCIQWAGFDIKQARFITDESISAYGQERFLCDGDLLWNSTGTGTAGRVVVYADMQNERCVADSHVTVIRPSKAAVPRYLWCVIASPWVQSRIQPTHSDSLVSGTTQQVELATNRVRALSIPCPPLEEQSRIVAKVDELMTLCDQLERQQQDRRKLQNALRQSTLQAVANAQSPQELRSTWAWLERNFAQLFNAPEDVAQLRSLCVELAIRGELVPSQSQTADGSVERLVRQLSSQTIGKRAAKVSRIEAPFAIPKAWQWVLVDDLLLGSDSGWSPKCDAEPRKAGEWGVLKVSAVTWGEFCPEENKRLPLSLKPRVECEVKSGDFLLSRANTADLVARSVIVPENVSEKLLMSDKIVRLHFIDLELKPWTNLVNNSLYARDYYRQNATGTSDSMRNVSRQVIHELPLPLPPKPIQVAIMRKLGQLCQCCDALKDQLRVAHEKAEQLALAAVSSLIGIAIEEEENRPMKAPRTELIAPLRLGQTPDVKTQAPLATLLVRHNGEMSATDLWQRFGGEIDAFYEQLKTEVAHGWIQEPAIAEMREKVVDTAEA